MHLPLELERGSSYAEGAYARKSTDSHVTRDRRPRSPLETYPEMTRAHPPSPERAVGHMALLVENDGVVVLAFVTAEQFKNN